METDALVIGSGPAGLMAAEALAAAGRRVTVAEAKPSPARKLLMAGKSGLNVTKAESLDGFVAAYTESARRLRPMIERFGPAQVEAWMAGLGQAVFTGSSGRVFPQAMKASPLVRAWLARLEASGAVLRRRWRWQGWDYEHTLFDTPEGPVRMTARCTVLALGGASWARLGSDGAWAPVLSRAGAHVVPFAPANMGLTVRWSPAMTRFYGTPVKPLRLMAGSVSRRGEVVVGRHGLEGGGLYAVSRAVREGAPLTLDLCPDLRPEALAKRLEAPQEKTSLSNYLRKTARLPPVKVALLREFARPFPDDVAGRVARIKALPIVHSGPRPLDEAISTAGGVAWDALDDGLMLRARPGVFVAGEMIDWEAPTGGYLMTGCLATGLWAGMHAAKWRPA